jgi:hypothetical protein
VRRAPREGRGPVAARGALQSSTRWCDLDPLRRAVTDRGACWSIGDDACAGLKGASMMRASRDWRCSGSWLKSEARKIFLAKREKIVDELLK